MAHPIIKFSKTLVEGRYYHLSYRLTPGVHMTGEIRYTEILIRVDKVVTHRTDKGASYFDASILADDGKWVQPSDGTDRLLLFTKYFCAGRGVSPYYHAPEHHLSPVEPLDLPLYAGYKYLTSLYRELLSTLEI